MTKYYRKSSKLLVLALVSLTMLACQNIAMNTNGEVQKSSRLHLDSFSWQLIELHQQRIEYTEQQKAPTLIFVKATNKVNGFAGCNNFFGTYTEINQQLTLSRLGMTRRYCAEVSALETRYENMLSKVTGFKIDENILQLTVGDAVVAVFKATK